jgi:hypothetical protein
MKVFQTITEGGQLATHSVRMFKQVTKTSVFITLLLWLSAFLYQMRDLNEFYLQCVWYYEQARFYQLLEIRSVPVSPQDFTHIPHPFSCWNRFSQIEAPGWPIHGIEQDSCLKCFLCLFSCFVNQKMHSFKELKDPTHCWSAGRFSQLIGNTRPGLF